MYPQRYKRSSRNTITRIYVNDRVKFRSTPLNSG